MKVLIAIYQHPEYYPPTLNAIQALGEISESIIVVTTNTQEEEWHYPKQVKFVKVGKQCSVEEYMGLSHWKKISHFLRFVKVVKRYIQEADLAIFYDAIPLLAFRCASVFLKHKPILWYHNHDVLELSHIKKYSLGWWAKKNERSIMSKLEIFSLPSLDRKKYFKLDSLKGKFYFLPNYPSIQVYGKRMNRKPSNGIIKLIYQGQVSEGHGLEEIIPYLGATEFGELQLTIIGRGDVTYKNLLLQHAKQFGTEQFVQICQPVSYFKLISITEEHQIGIAINLPKGIIYETGGTASNKIYEYIACGLPIIYFQHEQYKKYLARYRWAKSTDLSRASFHEAIKKIIADYDILSQDAKMAFHETLNFEKSFNDILKELPKLHN